MLRQDAREVLAALPGRRRVRRAPEAEVRAHAVRGGGGHRHLQHRDEAKGDLAATISQLQRITGERGTMLACAGTHPVSDWRDAKMAPIQRYAELLENLQWLARRIQTFGVHVHVGIRDRKQGDTHRQCARRVPAAFPGADRLEPVLERARHRARLEPVRDLRRTTDLGAAAAISRTGVSSRTTWTRFFVPGPSGASRRCGGISGRIPTSARSRSGCLTGCPPCGRSAWPRRCRSPWFTCWMPSSTAATRCRPVGLGCS